VGRPDGRYSDSAPGDRNDDRLIPLLILAVGCLFLEACSGSPTVTANAPAATSPPSALSATSPPAPVPSPITDRSGNYAGTAQPMNSGGGTCAKTLQVAGFGVEGYSVRFGVFHGSIDSAGGLQMLHGERWIVGQFEGPTFHGQFTIPPNRRSNPPGCSYVLSLERIGT
jgi:hypothetical protein